MEADSLGYGAGLGACVKLALDDGVDLRSAGLDQMRLGDVPDIKADLSYSSLRGAVVENTCLDGWSFYDCDLSHSGMSAVQAREAFFDRALMKRTNLLQCDFAGSSFRRAFMDGASLEGSDLRGADLSNAYLLRANLRDVDLAGANLQDAVLEEADLTNANLKGANMTGARLRGAVVVGAFVLGAIGADETLWAVRNQRYPA